MEKEEKFNEGVMLCIREHQLVEPDDKILVAFRGFAFGAATGWFPLRGRTL